MKISDLLETRIPKKFFMPSANEASQLPSAPSLNDEPSAVDGPKNDNDNEDDNGNIDAFISRAGDLGSDLYSLTIYNYSDDWANVNPGTPVRSVIENAAGSENRQVVDAYLNQDDSQIANDRMISNMILNSRNGRMFAFSSGINARPQFNPSAKNLVDGDQLGVLRRIQDAGKRYYDVVTSFDSEYGFKPGYEADKATNSAGESLIEELATPQFVKTKSISGKQHRDDMGADKKKWTDILNDPASSDRRKMMAKSHIKRITSQGY